ncbi:MAG TPA: SCO family protein [Rhizomicrobium sp.]|jgi:protein SCO1/2|nr:SCO family protein [Rhizomicrobium sp.]
MKSWAIILLTVLVVIFPATGTVFALPPIQGQFDLTTVDGRDVTLADYKGKWLLVYFGYTFCPDVCPAVLTEMGQALKELGPKAGHVQVLFITVDPVRDSAAVMKRYLKAFDPRIQGLRGDPDAIEVAAKSFHVYYRPRSVGGGEYAIDHSSYVYVLDPKGRFVQLLAPDVPGHKIAEDVRKLIH